MGLGALWGGRTQKVSLEKVFRLALILVTWTGITVPLLREFIGLFGGVSFIPIILVMVAGFLAGSLIPLLMRLESLRIRLPVLFLLDYVGAIIFTLIFTLICLVPLGYQRTGALLTFIAGLGFLALGFWRNPLVLLPLLLGGVIFVTPVRVRQAPQMGNARVESKILHQEQSHYQKIILTEEKRENYFVGGGITHVLYLDGFVQFSTLDEQIYHACLANIPMAAVQEQGSKVGRALILGGGDGLAARNLLKSKQIERVKLVELDPSMIRLAKSHPILRRYNFNSLHDPRVEVEVKDAFQYVFNTPERFDLILIDFPAPKNLTLARLFTVEFYQAVLKLLNPGGAISIQAGPSYSQADPSFMTVSEVTTSIAKSMRAAGAESFVYTTYPDNEAFVLAVLQSFDIEKFSKRLGIYSKGKTPHFCSFNPDWKYPAVEINTLNRLPLAGYMIEWFKKAGGMFFNYRGNYAVFLPD